MKWDASLIGETPPETSEPEKHPACLEVIEMNEGQQPVTTYRRPDHASFDGGRSVPG